MSPKVPPEFGSPETAWAVERDAAPHEVRALYLQHRVVLAARAFMGRTAKARDYAARLGLSEEKDVAKLRRKLAGKTPLALAELCEWSDAFHIDLTTVTGTTSLDSDAYPPLYRQYLTRASGRAAFRRPDDIDWNTTAAAVLEALSEDAYVTPRELHTDDTTRMDLFRALTGTGFNPALIRVEGDGLTLLLRDPTTIHLRTNLHSNDQAWNQLHRTLTDTSEDAVVLLMGATAIARLDTHFPQLSDTHAGSIYEVPPEAFEGTPRPDAPHLAWTVLANRRLDETNVLVIRRKRGQD